MNLEKNKENAKTRKKMRINGFFFIQSGAMNSYNILLVDPSNFYFYFAVVSASKNKHTEKLNSNISL